jgi:cell division protein FtsQ
VPGRLIVRSAPGRRPPLIVALAIVALLGGFLLFRSSPLVAVQQIQIVGVRGPQAAAVSEALEGAARQMSTLDYSAGGLEAAVAKYPIVRFVTATTSFPHEMRIDVTEQPPVAQLAAHGARSAVAADGVVLGSSLLSSSLPRISTPTIPKVGARVSGAQLRSYLTVLGATPVPLLPLISGVYVGQQGLTVKMANGLLVYFGDDSRPHAKWDALVTVLTAQGVSGASYVDVRLPERPAAKVASGGVGSSESEQVSASDPTSAALAASLARAVNGEPSASATTPSTQASPSTPSSATTQTESSSAGQASAPASAEPSTAPEGG